MNRGHTHSSGCCLVKVWVTSRRGRAFEVDLSISHSDVEALGMVLPSVSGSGAALVVGAVQGPAKLFSTSSCRSAAPESGMGAGASMPRVPTLTGRAFEAVLPSADTQVAFGVLLLVAPAFRRRAMSRRLASLALLQHKHPFRDTPPAMQVACVMTTFLTGMAAQYVLGTW